MTTKELLRPRYKVIADYPQSIYEVGYVIELYHKTNPVVEGQKGFYDMYPHLFKKLEWWEERTAEEIGYVCFNTDWHYVIGKVIRVLCNGWGEEIFRLDNCKFDVQAKYCLPFTKTA